MSASTKNSKDTRKRTRATISPAQLLEFGKLPPQAVDVEEIALGAIMMDATALSKVVNILKPEMFYRDSNKHIYRAIAGMFQDSESVDIVTVVQRLKKEETLEIAGGAYNITQLTSRVASAANVESHARIVIEKYLQRELIRVSTETLQFSYEDSTDVFELLEKAERALFSVSQDNIRKKYEDIRTLLGKAIKQIEDSRDQKFQGVPSGFSRLDAITGGWQNSDLILLGARSGMGKTAMVGAIARNAAVDHKKPVAIFSLEMTSMQLVMRLISSETEFTGDKLRRGDMSPDEFETLNTRIAKLAGAPLYIDDTPALSVFEFRAKARRLVMEHDVGLLIVDYLQLMTLGEQTRGNREQEVGKISTTLKAIAKELNVPIIALSQLSRAVETRTEKAKRPQLSDLRESGSLEQDADLVMFIYRPEYYGILEDEDGNSTLGIAEIIIAKHRNGRVGKENLIFIPHLAKFVEPNYTTFSSGSDINTSPAAETKLAAFRDVAGSGLNNIEEELF